MNISKSFYFLHTKGSTNNCQGGRIEIDIIPYDRISEHFLSKKPPTSFLLGVPPCNQITIFWSA